MTPNTFDTVVHQVALCPQSSESKTQCGSVIKRTWTTLVGWGNISAPLVFVGINPRQDPAARNWRLPANSDDRVRYAHQLASTGFADDNHFSYHANVMRCVRDQLGERVPVRLEEFAFFTELAYCPTADAGLLPEAALSRCWRINSGPFLLNAKFKLIIAIGKAPAQAVLRAAGLVEEAKQLVNFHGRVLELEPGRFLLASYQPKSRQLMALPPSARDGRDLAASICRLHTCGAANLSWQNQ